MSTIKNSQDLIDLYEAMDDERRQSLCDFADFLYAQADPISKEIPSPNESVRPEKETVVGAVKRLKEQYFMVESSMVFSAASELMTDNMVRGRDAVKVIDDMELLFENAYKSLLIEKGQEA